MLTLALTLTLTLALALTLTLSEHNALLWRPVNYNLAHYSKYGFKQLILQQQFLYICFRCTQTL